MSRERCKRLKEIEYSRDSGSQWKREIGKSREGLLLYILHFYAVPVLLLRMTEANQTYLDFTPLTQRFLPFMAAP